MERCHIRCLSTHPDCPGLPSTQRHFLQGEQTLDYPGSSWMRPRRDRRGGVVPETSSCNKHFIRTRSEHDELFCQHQCSLSELGVHQAPNPLWSAVNTCDLVSENQSSWGSSSPGSKRTVATYRVNVYLPYSPRGTHWEGQGNRSPSPNTTGVREQPGCALYPSCSR